METNTSAILLSENLALSPPSDRRLHLPRWDPYVSYCYCVLAAIFWSFADLALGAWDRAQLMAPSLATLSKSLAERSFLNERI